MKKVAVIVISLMTLVISSYAQIANLPDGVGTPLKSKKGETVDGKIYLHEEWNKATIEWKQGQITQDAFVKYNTLSGNLEIQNDNGVWEYSPKAINSFEYGVNLFPEIVKMKFEPAEKYFAGAKGFVRILFDDKILVLQRIDIEVVSSTSSYGAAGSTKRVVQSPKHFMLLPDSDGLTQFKRTNGSLANVAGKAEVKEYIKSKRLNLSNDRDLTLVAEYLKTFY